MTSTTTADSPKVKRIISREDSLEYFIKFPTPNFRQDSTETTAESDYVFVYNETNVPIVLLLGWAGCQDRYLMKYSKIYEDRGLITVRYTAPLEHLFWNRDAMKPIGEKILKLLFDMSFDSHPLIVHMFSNGGAYLYQHILLAMKQANVSIDIRGLIFDSAPGERRIMGIYRATSAIIGKERRCNFLISWMIAIAIVVSWSVEDLVARVISSIQSIPFQDRNPYKILKNEENRCPQLILYSNEDKLIPFWDIENFAKHRQEMGISVDLVCFEDAEHVKLYTKYPQKYVQSVCKFVNDCLSNSEQNSSSNKKAD